MMAKIIITEGDEPSIKMMQEALGTHQVEAHPTLAPALVRLNAEPFDLLILDNALLDKGFGAWLEDFKKNCKVEQNKNIKIVILSFQDEPHKVKQYLRQGAVDYLIKPIDKPLFMQKIALILTNKVEKQVYSFATSTAIDMAYEVTMEEVSEFGVTMHTNGPIQVGDLITLYGATFKTETGEKVLARCYQVSDHPEVKGDKLAYLTFVGVNQATLKQIRVWMKQEYIRKKQAA